MSAGSITGPRKHMISELVDPARFELAASCSRSKRATRLRYESIWSGKPDLNRRLPAPKAGVVPNSTISRQARGHASAGVAKKHVPLAIGAYEIQLSMISPVLTPISYRRGDGGPGKNLRPGTFRAPGLLKSTLDCSLDHFKRQSPRLAANMRQNRSGPLGAYVLL